MQRRRFYSIRDDVPILADRDALLGLSFRVSWPFKGWRKVELEALIDRYGDSIYDSLAVKVDYIITIRQSPFANELTPRRLLRLIQGKVPGAGRAGSIRHAVAVRIEDDDDEGWGPNLHLFSAEIRLLLQDYLRQKTRSSEARDSLDDSNTERELQQALHQWLKPTTFNTDEDDHPKSDIPSWLVSSLGPIDSIAVPRLDDMQKDLRRRIDLLSSACTAVGFDVVLAVMERSLDVLEVHDDLFLEEPPSVVKIRKQRATSPTERMRLKDDNAVLRTAAPRPPDRYLAKEWRRLVAVIVRPGDLRELRRQTLAKCSSKQLLERVCDCAAQIKSGVDDPQLKEDFIAVSTCLSEIAIATDTTLRSVRPDVSLQVLLGYLVDASLLSENDELLATVISRDSIAGADVLRATEWQAKRKDFNGMKAWLSSARQSYARGPSGRSTKNPIKRSAAARMSYMREVFSILHREYEHKDACERLQKEIQKLPRSATFQLSDAPDLLELSLQCDRKWFRIQSVRLFEHWPGGDPFPCVFFMATLDAHVHGQLSREEIRKVFNEFIDFFDDKMFFEEESSDGWYRERSVRAIRREERTAVSEHIDRPWPLSSQRRFFATSKELANMTIQSLKLDREVQLRFLLRRLSYVPEAQEVSARRELLRELLAAVKGSGSLLKVPLLDRFVRPVIEEWQTYIKNPPWLDDNLVWPIRGCKSCVDCNTLDDFLLNGNEEAMTLHVSPKRASHVESRVVQTLAEDPRGLRLAQESFDSRRCLLTVTKTDARWAKKRTERQRSRTDYKAAFLSLVLATAQLLLGEEGYGELSYDTGSDLKDIFGDFEEDEEDEKREDVTQLERITFAQVSNLKRPLSPVHVNASVKRRMLQVKSNAVSIDEQENQPPVSAEV